MDQQQRDKRGEAAIFWASVAGAVVLALWMWVSHQDYIDAQIAECAEAYMDFNETLDRCVERGQQKE